VVAWLFTPNVAGRGAGIGKLCQCQGANSGRPCAVLLPKAVQFDVAGCSWPLKVSCSKVFPRSGDKNKKTGLAPGKMPTSPVGSGHPQPDRCLGKTKPFFGAGSQAVVSNSQPQTRRSAALKRDPKWWAAVEGIESEGVGERREGALRTIQRHFSIVIRRQKKLSIAIPCCRRLENAPNSFGPFFADDSCRKGRTDGRIPIMGQSTTSINGA